MPTQLTVCAGVGLPITLPVSAGEPSADLAGLTSIVNDYPELVVVHGGHLGVNSFVVAVRRLSTSVAVAGPVADGAILLNPDDLTLDEHDAVSSVQQRLGLYPLPTVAFVTVASF